MNDSTHVVTGDVTPLVEMLNVRMFLTTADLWRIQNTFDNMSFYMKFDFSFLFHPTSCQIYQMYRVVYHIGPPVHTHDFELKGSVLPPQIYKRVAFKGIQTWYYYLSQVDSFKASSSVDLTSPLCMHIYTYITGTNRYDVFYTKTGISPYKTFVEITRILHNPDCMSPFMLADSANTPSGQPVQSPTSKSQLSP